MRDGQGRSASSLVMNGLYETRLLAGSPIVTRNLTSVVEVVG